MIYHLYPTKIVYGDNFYGWQFVEDKDLFLIQYNGNTYFGKRLELTTDTVAFATEMGIKITRNYSVINVKNDVNKSKGPCIAEATSIPYLDRYGLYVFTLALKKAVEYMGICVTNNIKEANIVHYHIVGPIHIPSEFKDKIIIGQFHGFKPDNFDEYKNKFDDIIFISAYQQREIFNTAYGHILWNPVVPFEVLNNEREYHFMFAQSDYPEKNTKWILKHASNNKKFSIIVAGRVNVPGAYNVGYKTLEELNYLHSLSHIFVMPSTKEAFGLAPVYAMMQGVVPAISVHSGIAEFVPKDISIHFEPDNSDLDDLWSEYKKRKLYNKRKEIINHVKLLYPDKWAYNFESIVRGLFWEKY